MIFREDVFCYNLLEPRGGEEKKEEKCERERERERKS
jgi:hypothetical protein